MAKVYIHEFVDINGHNRARYMQHITANWSPIGQTERNQLCYGIWGTVGSTGSWPEVINMWEYEGWEGLSFNLGYEMSSPTLQDPALAEWWAQAEHLRRGGFDRIMVAAPWSPSIEQLVEQGIRGALYAHELVKVAPGQASELLALVEKEGKAQVESQGAVLVGAFRTAMADDSECLLLWALPSWDVWTSFEQAWEEGGGLVAWRDSLIAFGATWQRFLLVDAPLSPMRIGRQPAVSDRRPLSEI